MNILLIAVVVSLIWRIAADTRRGIVCSVFALINTVFAALVIGMLCVAVNAYHAENYLAIGISVVLIAVLSILYSIIKLVFFPAKVLSKLPIVKSVDKLLGVVIGLAETIVAFWIFCYIVMFVDLGSFNQMLLHKIAESKILTFLYEYNLVGVLLESVKEKIGLFSKIGNFLS